MTARRVTGTAGSSHPHRAWESQPLVGPTRRPRTYSLSMLALSFALGAIMALLIV